MGETKILDKQSILDKLLEQEYVLVHISTNNPYLRLPDYLLDQPSVTLKLSRLFRFPVELLDAHISVSLLFKGEYFHCEIPWDAVWGATSAEGKGRVWPESVPPKLIGQFSHDPSLRSITPMVSDLHEAPPEKHHEKKNSIPLNKETVHRDVAHAVTTEGDTHRGQKSPQASPLALAPKNATQGHPPEENSADEHSLQEHTLQERTLQERTAQSEPLNERPHNESTPTHESTLGKKPSRAHLRRVK